MDPLSITAGVVACGGAAKGTMKVLQKIRSYTNSSQEIDTLIYDLKDIQALLQRTSELIVNADLSPSKEQFLAQQVTRLGDKIAKLDQVINAPRHHIPGVSEERHARFSWVKHERKIKLLRNDLVDAKTNVTNALTFITASSTTDIGKSMTTSLDLHNQSLSKLTGVIEKINIIQKAVQGLQGPTDSLSGNNLSDRSNDQPSNVVSFPHQGQGTDVPVSLEGTDLILKGNAMLPRSGASSRWQAPGLEKCGSWCSCRCHSKTTIVAPRFLSSVLGKTVVEYAGIQATCNEHSCRGSRKSGLELSYCVPKFLSHQYIFVKMSRAPLGNPTVILRMPRTMDWTHLLWKYAPRGDLTAVQTLFNSAKAAPDDTNFQGGTALLLASAYPKLYQFLIQAGADLSVSDMHERKPVNLIGERLLSGRIPDGDVESTEALLAETDFMESRQFSTIHKSVLRLSERVLADELQETTSSLNAVDTEGRTPLIWATMRDDLTTLSTLLGFGADANVRDYAGIISLHYVRSTDACNALIKAGANVHTRNRTRRRTCVHHACKSIDNPDLINLLHEKGADIDVRDVDAETPLFHAVSCNFTSTAKELIDLGADVNAANVSSKDSVLHMAVAFDHCEIIPKLLHKGADYTFTNRYGKTIAHKAASWGTRYTVELLSQLSLSNLDLSVKDADGKTASDYIAERDVLLESEAGIHDSFARFMTAVEEAKATEELECQDPSNGIIRTNTDTAHPPGQFPSD